MQNIKEFRITNSLANKRADLALLTFMPELTRTATKKIFVEGIVTINDLQVKPNYKVKDNDQLLVDTIRLASYLQGNQNSTIKPSFKPIDIIYEDQNIIVVNKPERLVSHPVPGHRDDSVLNRLVGRSQKSRVKNQPHPASLRFGHPLPACPAGRHAWRGAGGEVGKLRLVHRLDRDTSGVLLAAKNIETQQFFSRLFEKNLVHKTYYAVVKGDFKKYLQEKKQQHLVITSYIARSNLDQKIYHNTSIEKGQFAKTTIFFERYWKGLNGKFSLLRCEPETGRTHQIRVHLSSIGSPIVGDPWYGGVRYKRLMLHAYSLKVEKLEGLKVGEGKPPLNFIAELPNEFRL